MRSGESSVPQLGHVALDLPNRHVAGIKAQNLVVEPVATVAFAAAGRIALLVAEMLGQFGPKCARSAPSSAT
jgi:hypothetical protein